MCPQAFHIYEQQQQEQEEGYLLGGRPSRGNGLRGRKVSGLDYSKHRYPLPGTVHHSNILYFAFWTIPRILYSLFQSYSLFGLKIALLVVNIMNMRKIKLLTKSRVLKIS